MNRRILEICCAVAVVVAPNAVLSQPVVTRGPYLGSATQTSVVIRWRTDVASESRILFGSAPGGLFGIVDDPTVTTEHELEVTGLDPETTYFYALGTPTDTLAGDDAQHYFRTHPLAGSRRPVRVWVIGDSGTGNINADRVYDAYRSYPGADETNVWLMLGDNAYSTGLDTEYQTAVFETYTEFLQNTVLWPTRGNHDILHSGPNNDYYEIFTMPTAGQSGGLASGSEAYYSFDYANVHFVCLDSQGSDRSVNSPMLTWLRNDLAATTQGWVIAYWHHPPYTKGSHNSDNAADSQGRMRDMRENVLPVLDSAGVDLVLSGHSHSYERSFLLNGHYLESTTLHDSMKIDPGDGDPFGDGAYLKATAGLGPQEGAVYAVAGSSGRLSGGLLNHPVMITSLNLFGSMVIDVFADQMEVVFIDSTGTERDNFTIRKGVATAVDPRIPTVRLFQNAPNPFSGSTTLTYSVAMSGRVQLSVYDVTGAKVADLVDGHRGIGEFDTMWNGTGADGRRVAQGVYFAVLRADGQVRARKITLIR